MKTILIAEDNLRIAQILRLKLQEKGYQNIHVVNSPEEAIKFVVSNPVDLVFIDLYLSELSGIHMSTFIKKAFENTKLVAIGQVEKPMSESDYCVFTRNFDAAITDPMDNRQLQNAFSE